MSGKIILKGQIEKRDGTTTVVDIASLTREEVDGIIDVANRMHEAVNACVQALPTNGHAVLALGVLVELMRANHVVSLRKEVPEANLATLEQCSAYFGLYFEAGRQLTEMMSFRAVEAQDRAVPAVVPLEGRRAHGRRVSHRRGD